MKDDGGDRFVESVEGDRRRLGVEGWGLRKRGVGFTSRGELALPEFEGSVASGGEELILIEGESVDKVAVGGVGEGGIDELGIELAAMEVVDEEAIAAGDGGEASLGGDRGGVAGLDPAEVGPLSGARKGDG